MNVKLLCEKLGLHSLQSVVTRPELLVYKGQMNHKHVAVKIHKQEYLFNREVKSLRLLNSKSVRVPQLICEDKIDEDFIIIEDWMDGKPIAPLFSSYNEEKQSFLMEKIGEVLAEMQFALSKNELKESDFWLRHNYDASTFEEFSWKSYIERQVDKWIGRIKLSEEDRQSSLEQHLAAIKDRINGLEEPPRTTFIHCDFGFRNLLIRPDESDIKGVIDFEGASIGDPLWDLAKLPLMDLHDKNTELEQRLFYGWENASSQSLDLERINLYKSLEGLAGIAWVDKQAQMTDQMRMLRQRSIAYLDKYCSWF
ncbi:MAG: phosphotransferase [Bacillaceae bacterium]|nr:phosphotransferase [Bacillaceae bacterium]